MKYIAKATGHNVNESWELSASNDSEAISNCEDRLYTDWPETNIHLQIYEITDYLVPTANRHMYDKQW